MLLHTSRTMDGPWIKTVHVVSHIFWCIFFHGARNRGLSDLLERWIRKPHPRNKSSKYAPTESFWGLNNKPSTSYHWFLCFGTRPRHQTRAPWHGPPRLKKAKSNFFTNCNILHTHKKEPLNIILLHTSRRMDGPWIKTVPVVSHIFDVSSSTGLESRAIWPVGKMN